MYAGNSGCFGIIVYNTDIKGDNAVYGYYKGSEMRFMTGTQEEVKDFRNRQEEDLGVKGGHTARRLVILFFVYLLLIITGFIVIPLRLAFALLVFCVLSYMPILIIATANDRLFAEDSMQEAFCRFHGTEHAILSALTKEKDCTMEELQKSRIYDAECGTAYSGYFIFLALEIAFLIALWPGLLKSIIILAVTIIILLAMILLPAINPFTLLQHKVVKQPTLHEYQLGLEIMKKVKELENGKVLL